MAIENIRTSSLSSDFDKEGLVIEKDRVLTYSKLICPLDCIYCFAENLSKQHDDQHTYLSEKQRELLKTLPENVKTIMLGCDTELLQDEGAAADVLRNLSGLGKDISIITKLSLTDDFVDFLKELSTTMEKNGNFIVFSISIPCFDSSLKWEPKAPRVANRIKTLQKISSKGIPSMVAMRPLIPTLQESELDKILENTHQHVFGYYSGPLYLRGLSDGVISPEEVTRFNLKVEKTDPSWMPEGNTFLKIENTPLMNYMKNRVKFYGQNFFEGAAEGVEFLRKNHKGLR